MKLYPTKVLLVLSLLVLVGLGRSYSQPIQVLSVTAPPSTLECVSTSVMMTVQLGCLNFQFDSTSFTISGNTIDVGAYYSDPGICLPAIGTASHTIVLGNVPAGTYTITASSYLDLVLGNSQTTTMTSISCCGAVPAINASATSICPGDTVTFTNGSTGDSVRSWYVDNVFISNANSFDHVFPNVGSSAVKLVVTGSGGCQDSTIENITVNALPNVDLGPDVAYCTGSSATLDAGPGWASQLWSTGATTQTISVSIPGPYSVQVVDANGCSNGDTINVTETPVPVVDLGGNVVTCPGTVTLDAGNPGASYQWNTGDTLQSIFVTQSGGYAVTVTAAGGCSAYDSVFVLFQLAPNVDLGSDTILCAGSSITLDATVAGATAYLWSDGSTNPTLTISPNNPSAYHVTVTGSNGCVGYDTIMIDLAICDGLERGIEDKLSIHPNPAKDHVVLEFEDGTEGAWQFVIVGNNGKTLKMGTFEVEKKKTVIDLEGFSSGIYLIRLFNETETVTRKLVID